MIEENYSYIHDWISKSYGLYSYKEESLQSVPLFNDVGLDEEAFTEVLFSMSSLTRNDMIVLDKGLLVPFEDHRKATYPQC
jgi:hypothetical protein